MPSQQFRTISDLCFSEWYGIWISNLMVVMYHSILYTLTQTKNHWMAYLVESPINARSAKIVVVTIVKDNYGNISIDYVTIALSLASSL